MEHLVVCGDRHQWLNNGAARGEEPQPPLVGVHVSSGQKKKKLEVKVALEAAELQIAWLHTVFRLSPP